MENHRNILNDELTQKQREFVWEYILGHNLIDFSDGIISAPKAFVINAVLRHAVAEVQKENMSVERWERIKRMISQYVAGIVDLQWHQGKIRIIEIEDDDTKRKRTKSRKRTS